MLRQAPNVILVGEMRDLETAQMGIQASLTGHLVFSTLHTNDAPSAITRLVDMGVPAYLVASSVIAIMAQRLVRVVCQKCKQPYTPSEAALAGGRHHARNGRQRQLPEGQGLRQLPGERLSRPTGHLRADVDVAEDSRADVQEAPTEQIRRRLLSRRDEDACTGTASTRCCRASPPWRRSSARRNVTSRLTYDGAGQRLTGFGNRRQGHRRASADESGCLAIGS